MSADVALEVRNLRVPGSSAGLDLTLRRGEVLGLTGRRRSGLQEIAGALTGEIPAQADAVSVHGEQRPVPDAPGAVPLRLAAYRPDDDAYGMDPRETIARTLTDAEWGRPDDLRTEIATLRGVIDTVHRMNVRTMSIRTVFGALSGGDQHKLALARWMAAADGDVVVVHEPTRGLDLRSRREVRRLLDDVTAHGRSVVVVSVDPDELADVCDRIGWCPTAGSTSGWTPTRCRRPTSGRGSSARSPPPPDACSPSARIRGVDRRPSPCTRSGAGGRTSINPPDHRWGRRGQTLTSLATARSLCRASARFAVARLSTR